MPRFFVRKSQISEGIVRISGDDAFHISRSLRMAAGERITVCDSIDGEYECELCSFGSEVTARIVQARAIISEPPFSARVWQALPKGDKLDTVIQKAVECGASSIGLFESSRCITHATRDSELKKAERRARISLEAAKQSGRGMVPPVDGCVGFAAMLSSASSADMPLFCYEGTDTLPLGAAIENFISSPDFPEHPTVSIVVGPEGGFAPDEADAARAAGMTAVGLGKRILRTETAASFVLAALVCRLELG